MEIADSARKHGILDEDIGHAVRMALRAISQEPDRILFVGPDRAGQLLEVVVLDPDEDPVASRHAPPTAVPPLPVEGEADA